MKIRGRGALVTGAASGLGLATARALHAAGARLVLVDLDRVAVSKVARELGNDVCPVAADVGDPAAVAAAIDLAAGEYGELRIAVNCAGVASAAKICSGGEAHDLELWSRVIAINLTGTFNVMRIAAARMSGNALTSESEERGVIVNTASIAAFDGQKGQAAYAASKAGVVGMTLPVARDLAECAIRCVAIAPGLFETPILSGIPEKGRAALNRSVLHPSRPGRPEEFASLVLHVVENPYVNATCLRLDGGARLS